jgi:hypothetical protein
VLESWSTLFHEKGGRYLLHLLDPDTTPPKGMPLKTFTPETYSEVVPMISPLVVETRGFLTAIAVLIRSPAKRPRQAGADMRHIVRMVKSVSVK